MPHVSLTADYVVMLSFSVKLDGPQPLYILRKTHNENVLKLLPQHQDRFL